MHSAQVTRGVGQEYPEALVCAPTEAKVLSSLGERGSGQSALESGSKQLERLAAASLGKPRSVSEWVSCSWSPW